MKRTLQFIAIFLIALLFVEAALFITKHARYRRIKERVALEQGKSLSFETAVRTGFDTTHPAFERTVSFDADGFTPSVVSIENNMMLILKNTDSETLSFVLNGQDYQLFGSAAMELPIFGFEKGKYTLYLKADPGKTLTLIVSDYET